MAYLRNLHHSQPILACFVRQTKKKERQLVVYSIKASTDINNPWSTLSRLTFDRHFDGHLIDSWLTVSRVFTNSYILINTWWRICETYHHSQLIKMSIKCWVSIDGISIEGINQHSTMDTFSLHDYPSKEMLPVNRNIASISHWLRSG